MKQKSKLISIQFCQIVSTIASFLSYLNMHLDEKCKMFSIYETVFITKYKNVFALYLISLECR